MLPTRAQSMFSGNNNTSDCLTAYLCKNSARGGIWSALVLFFETTSFRYVPLAVVMFSLPYQFCRDGKFYYRAYLVCHSQMPSLQVAGVFFPRFRFFLRDCIPITPHPSPAKDMFSSEKGREWENDRSLLLEYIDCPWFIGFLLQEVAQPSANRETFVSAICFGTFEADNFLYFMNASFFMCVSSRRIFAVCVWICV